MGKVCSACGEEKDLSFFYKRSKLTYRGQCKKCCNDRTKEWGKQHPERIKDIKQKSRDNTKETRYPACRRYRQNHPEKALWAAASCRAKKYGIDFNIEVEDIIIPPVCPVFGVPLVISSGKAAPNSMSLDRIYPEKGYVKGNIQVISNLANLMKSSASEEELIQFANWILNSRKKND